MASKQGAQGSAPAADTRVLHRRLGAVAYVLSLLWQLCMVVVGITFATTDDYEDGFFSLLLWCGLGTVYAIVVIIVLGRLSRRDRPATSHQPSRIELSRPARIVSTSATILASFVGLGAATELLALRHDAAWQGTIEIIGVWAMLLAWGFLHWGFAQMYSQSYYSSIDDPPLRFPRTPYPRITDFVYFSYTIGTSFAASDVETLKPMIRWRVVWHSVASFFFNGLIIVLALNTITSI